MEDVTSEIMKQLRDNNILVDAVLVCEAEDIILDTLEDWYDLNVRHCE